MMMNFQDNNKRHFQCFICGLVFKMYDEMKKHIFEKHEESREYIVCPVKHCGAPVRDLRFHFRTRHPACKCPKTGQMRATVMYDVKAPGKRRKIPTFKEGYIVSKKNNGEKMHYRSGYEKEVYDCLERIGDVIAYKVEPFSVPYYHKGKMRQYFPDLLIQYSDGSVEMWEVKPSNQTAASQNQAKFKAAELYCTQRGWRWDIITEQRIEQLKKKSQ